mgnify:CR=1
MALKPLQAIVLNSGAQKSPYPRVRSIEPAKNHFTFKLKNFFEFRNP